MRSMWRVVVLAPVVAGLLIMGSSAFAQPGGRGGGGFGGGNNTGLDLLRDENVRKELDLEEGQLTKLQDLAGKMQDEVRAQFQGFDFAALRELSEEDRDARMAEIREKVAKVTTDLQKEIDEVLLPRQRERLKQIVVQSQMRRQGASGAITSGALAEQLGITEEQKEKLAEKQREIEAETRAKIEKIRQDAQDDLLSVLTPAQQAKLKQMIGEPITFAPTQFGQGGPGGAGGGGFGGQRGGPGGAGGGGFGGRGRGGDRGGDNGGRNN